MLFDYKYAKNTEISGTAKSTSLLFAPDVLRPPVFFQGILQQALPFREAMSALHQVVTSDLRYQAPDKTAYKEWAAQNEEKLLAEIVSDLPDVQEKIGRISHRLTELRKQKYEILKPFYDAQSKYRQYTWKHDRDMSYILDPVITVHPDEIFFECFSIDESTYGRLSCKHEVFQQKGNFACGTTNIDYSAGLYGEFQKIRKYKETQFQIDPSGFEVQTEGEADYKEVKIDLPDSWVRGFLQVSAAAALPSVSFELQPLDMANVLRVLKQKKEIVGPRSIRFRLTPDKPVVLIIEPWNIEIICPRSIFNGKETHEIRLWGRRRLLILERLLQLVQKFTVHLYGNGLPSFFIAHMENFDFTLGLSGWTDNDWSTAGNFDLLAPRAQVDAHSKQVVFDALSKVWFAKANDLALTTGLNEKTVLGALLAWTQAGRVIFDPNKGVYRLRELKREPIKMEEVHVQNPREVEAEMLLVKNAVQIQTIESTEGHTTVLGEIQDNRKEEVELLIDKEERLRKATCTCRFYYQNKLRKGPCTHILAARMAHNKQYSFLKKMFG